VGIVMGSDSDLPIMKKAALMLEDLEIPFEVTIASAHRHPELSRQFALGAEDRGLKVIIAGAGAAAHLAGVIAAHTWLPVIGVPLTGSPLGGKDALYATVQMPPGVPVATVGIDGARNAAILAAQILATSDEDIAARLKDYKRKLAEGVETKANRLAEVGYRSYRKLD